MTDYNAMADEDFRREVRTFVEREYPQHLRFILQRARWHEMKDWWRKLYEQRLDRAQLAARSGAAWRSTRAR